MEGRPVLNSSHEIETLLHTMALVLNRGMLVRCIKVGLITRETQRPC